MGIMSRAFGSPQNKYSETGQNYKLGHSVNPVSSLLGTGNGDNLNLLKEYSGFVWKVINARSLALASEDIYVETKVGDKWQKRDDHDFNTVLDGDEGTYDLSELLEAHSVSMDVYGEAFWYFSEAEGSRFPHSIYLLDPNAMTVMVQDFRVVGYVYQKDGNKILFDVQEIDHYFIHNPSSRHRGMSPMQAAGWFIKSARYVNTYVNNFLENNAIPAGVIVAAGAVDDGDWELFKEQWQSKYGGIDNSGKTGYIRGQDLSFVKTGLSLGEVDFAAMKNSTREDILAMYSTPQEILGILKDANRASATVALQFFALQSTKPALTKLVTKLSKRVGRVYGPTFRVGATNPVPDDEDLELATDVASVNVWETANEIRARRGLPPIDGGDVLVSKTPTSPTPPVDPNAKPVKSLEVKPKLIVRLKTKSIKISNTKNNSGGFTYEMKESFRSSMESRQKEYEEKYLKAMQPVIKAQKEAVLAQIAPKKVASANLDVEAEANKMVEAGIGVLIDLAKAQGQASAEFVGNKESVFDFTSVMETYIKSSLKKASLGFTEDTKALIGKAIEDGLTAGESIAKIAKRIDAIYEDALGVKAAGYRIERVARTEVIKSSNEITEAAYRQSGVVSKKEWISNPGACQFCSALNGTVINLGAVFVPKDGTVEGKDGGVYKNTYEDVTHPGIHPDCRCALIPIIDAA